MPGMDVIEAISRIQNEFDGREIIVLTTYPSDVQVLRAFKAGACALDWGRDRRAPRHEC
jgi:CheY-like chemotaxis protein